MKEKIETYLRSDDKEMIYLGIAMIGDSIHLTDKVDIINKHIQKKFGIEIVNNEIVIFINYFNLDSALFVKDPTRLLKLGQWLK